MLDEALIGLVGLELGIERHPDFRAFLADSRDQGFPGGFRDGVRLFYPGDIDALERLDVGDVVTNAGKRELSTVPPLDRRLLDLVEAREAQGFHLVREQLVNA